MTCYWQICKSCVIAISPQNLNSLIEKTIFRNFLILIPIIVIVRFNSLNLKRRNSFELLDSWCLLCTIRA